MRAHARPRGRAARCRPGRRRRQPARLGVAGAAGLAPADRGRRGRRRRDPRRRPPAGRHRSCSTTSSTTAAEHGGAIPVRDQGHLAALRRRRPSPDRVVAVQTPQAFPRRPLLDGVPAGGRGRLRRHRHRELHRALHRRAGALRRRATPATSRSPSPTTCSWPSGCWPRPARTCPAAASRTPATAGCTCPASAARGGDAMTTSSMARPALRDLRPGHRARAALRRPAARVDPLHGLRRPPRASPARAAAGVPRRPRAAGGQQAAPDGAARCQATHVGYARELPRAIAPAAGQVPGGATVDLPPLTPPGGRLRYAPGVRPRPRTRAGAPPGGARRDDRAGAPSPAPRRRGHAAR